MHTARDSRSDRLGDDAESTIAVAVKVASSAEIAKMKVGLIHAAFSMIWYTVSSRSSWRRANSTASTNAMSERPVTAP